MTVDPTSSEQPAPGQAGVDPAVRARIAEADFDLRNASMMVKKPGWTLRLLGTFFFKKVRFEPEQVDTLRDLAVDGSVIYVLPSQSLLDYLYFNWAFLHQKLPLAVYGKGMRMWPFRTLAAQLRSMFRWAFRRRKPKAESDILFQAPAQRRPVVLFLRRARALLPWAGDFDEDPLRDVVEAREALDTPVHLVPMMVVWERAPGGFRRGMFDTVFGDPDAPGRLRKVINFIGNHRRALVQLGDPIEVGAFIEEHKHLERREAVGQKIRWALNHGFRVERKVIKGPVLKDAAQIREEILRLGDFQQELSEIAHERGVPLAEVQEEADGYLEEIVADWKLSYIEMFCILLTFVFSRIYAGIEVKGLPSVREAARKAPLVILPSHKSHLDYLLVSYVFYIHGLVPPHIAAGQNLSFWPMGHLFRRSGAFFLRRSFGINPLYASTFRTYVHKLIKAGYTLEFFLEGGRSRTGKLLPPKYGLLSNVVDAVMSGVVHDVQMVPASICYEKIVEGEGYARELSGRPKENENLGQLVNATKVLAERFGQVYLSFPQPFSLREYLESLGLDLEAGFDDDDHRRHVVKALGYRVLGDVNSATVVTASAVVATALLANPRRGISRPELLRRSGAVLDYVLQTRAPLAATLQHQLAANRASLERARSGVQGTLESALANFDGDGEMARVLGETLG
ncbi:MAG: glycerol-3-phosphate O-acyltransferase, partial [Myxococcota bacterium]